MDDFDWVTARSQCSLPAIFEKLLMQIQADIEKVNSLRGSEPPFRYVFKLVRNGSVASVIREGDRSVSFDRVKFALKPTSVEVLDAEDKVVLSATPTISNDGECRLRVKDNEIEMWQLRKLALENTFFNF